MGILPEPTYQNLCSLYKATLARMSAYFTFWVRCPEMAYVEIGTEPLVQHHAHCFVNAFTHTFVLSG